MQPVEYAVAVERYLDAAPLSEGSQRIYRIALTMWAWVLVDRVAPVGSGRRGAAPPVVPLAALDGVVAAERLRQGLAARAAVADARTVNREVSILRSATSWWISQGWIAADPTAALNRGVEPVVADGRLSDEQVRAVFALSAGVRDQALWHVLHETGASIERVLALDVDDLDFGRRQTRDRRGSDAGAAGATGTSEGVGVTGDGVLRWSARTARLVTLMLAGRTTGPLFITDRRAPSKTAPADRCPVTGRARLSYRRAAEIFTAATAGLDPAGRGWTLRRL